MHTTDASDTIKGTQLALAGATPHAIYICPVSFYSVIDSSRISRSISMGHSSAVEPAYRVLPVIDEESESESESGSSGSEGAALESKTELRRRITDRQKAIVSRMRELFRRAAAAQSAQSKLRSTVVVSAKKWKRAVSFQNRRDEGARKQLDQQILIQGDDMSSSSVSSKNSFSWDVAAASADSCSTTMSPEHSPLWPAFVSAQAYETAAGHRMSSATSNADLRLSSCTMSTRSSGSAADMIRLFCSGSPPPSPGVCRPSDGVKMMSRMAQWITTDSDFVVLEL